MAKITSTQNMTAYIADHILPIYPENVEGLLIHVKKIIYGLTLKARYHYHLKGLNIVSWAGYFYLRILVAKLRRADEKIQTTQDRDELMKIKKDLFQSLNELNSFAEGDDCVKCLAERSKGLHKFLTIGKTLKKTIQEEIDAEEYYTDNRQDHLSIYNDFSRIQSRQAM